MRVAMLCMREAMLHESGHVAEVQDMTRLQLGQQ